MRFKRVALVQQRVESGRPINPTYSDDRCLLSGLKAATFLTGRDKHTVPHNAAHQRRADDLHVEQIYP